MVRQLNVHLLLAAGDGRVEKGDGCGGVKALSLTGTENDTVACAGVLVSTAVRGLSIDESASQAAVVLAAVAGQVVELVEQTAGKLGARHVCDARAGRRRAEAAVEEPEVEAADEPPVVPRERRASHGVAGRQAGEDVEQDLVVADAAAVSSPPRHGGSLPPAPRIAIKQYIFVLIHERVKARRAVPGK